MNKLPLARTADIVVQTLGEEILIYDLNNHKAFNLNKTSSIVYQACDGKTTFEELKTRNKFTDDLIFLALDQLREDNLIETDKSFVSPFNGLSRREAIRKAGLASVIALPVISSLTAPTAAQAQSAGATAGLGDDCTAATCSPGLTCTTQFGSTACRASAGASCSFNRPDLCTSGCCTASPNGPVCCSF